MVIFLFFVGYSKYDLSTHSGETRLVSELTLYEWFS